MSKYNESSVLGESWTRAFQILIENKYGTSPKVIFSEEDVIQSSDGKIARNYQGNVIEERFTPENMGTRFQLKNPLTEEYIDGQFASYTDLHILIHSLYFFLAKRRDAPPSPFKSWIFDGKDSIWRAPIDKPIDENNYAWNEETLSWEVSISPYPSWIFDDVNQIWRAPTPKPTDGPQYIWNEELLSWVVVEE